MDITEKFDEEVLKANLREVKRQRDELLHHVFEMKAFIQTFPIQLSMARLDGKEGRETRYDYQRHNRCCKIR